MAETKKYTCVGCPVGCPLQLEHERNKINEISGYECDRGAKYARQEFMDPRRDVSTTIAISGAVWNRLPVKSNKPIPKGRVMEAVREVHELRVRAPTQLGQVLIEDLLGIKGIHVVACRSMERVK